MFGLTASLTGHLLYAYRHHHHASPLAQPLVHTLPHRLDPNRGWSYPLFIRVSLEPGWCRSPQSQGGHRMGLHADVLLGPKGREVMVLRALEQERSVTEAALAA
jgi:hypothetical protein